MTARYFTHQELQDGIAGLPNCKSLLYTAGGPMPALMLVWRHPTTAQVLLRYTTMTPLTWEPFSMMVSAPLDDALIIENLQEGATCVMAWGSRDTVRAHYLAALDLPEGLDQLTVARLHPVASPYGAVPHIAECPLNMECHVDRIIDHNGSRTYWLIIDAMSLDEEILPLPREVVLQRYHLYQADRVMNAAGGEDLRLGVAGELIDCPQFPVGPKSGWYSTFPTWIGELRDEGYLSCAEHDKISGWHERYLELFDELDNAERVLLHERVTAVCEALCWEEWPKLHTYLTD